MAVTLTWAIARKTEGNRTVEWDQCLSATHDSYYLNFLKAETVIRAPHVQACLNQLYALCETPEQKKNVYSWAWDWAYGWAPK